MILATTDFIADYRISFDPKNQYQVARVTEIMAEYERKIMLKLIGSEMYNEILDSTLGGGVETPSDDLVYIFNAFYYSNCGTIIMSDGMKTMLARMVYLYIARNSMAGNTLIGDRNASAEVSNGVDAVSPVRIYNQGVDTYNAIQYYIGLNRDKYPTYTGICERHSSFI